MSLNPIGQRIQTGSITEKGVFTRIHECLSSVITKIRNVIKQIFSYCGICSKPDAAPARTSHELSFEQLLEIIEVESGEGKDISGKVLQAAKLLRNKAEGLRKNAQQYLDTIYETDVSLLNYDEIQKKQDEIQKKQGEFDNMMEKLREKGESLYESGVDMQHIRYHIKNFREEAYQTEEIVRGMEAFAGRECL